MKDYQTSKTDHRESSENYRHIIVQDGRYRVIVCKDGIQWILQRQRKSPKNPTGGRWDGKSYHRERNSLQRVWWKNTGRSAQNIDELPDHFRRGFQK